MFFSNIKRYFTSSSFRYTHTNSLNNFICTENKLKYGSYISRDGSFAFKKIIS